MKRLISLFLCAAMLVGMVVTTVGAENWGDSGIGVNNSTLISPEHEQVYASNGYGLSFDTTGTNSRLYIQTFDDSAPEMTGEFYYFFGTYITATDSGKDSFIGMGNDASGVSAYYDFNRKMFVIGKGSGWNCNYDTDESAGGMVTLDYDLPLNQWFNFGVHFSTSKTEILLNGEVVLSANYGYTDGTPWLFWPNGIAGYFDNINMYDVTDNQRYGASNYASAWNNKNGYATDDSANSCLGVAGATGNWAVKSSGVPSGQCGMQWAKDLISTAYSTGTGVTEAQITAANNAWNALSPSQKYSIGLSADKNGGEGYNHLLGMANGYYYTTNNSTVAAAKNAISTIGTVTYPGSYSAIEAAKSAYASAASYNWDTGCNAHFTTDWDTKAIDAVVDKATLDAAIEAYTELENAENSEDKQNQAAADAVIAKINAIGAVTYTDVSKAKIDAARSAYNALTAAQQALVTNVSTLTAAEKTYSDLKAAAEQAAADKAAANDVISKINAIGTVSYTNISKIVIDDARTAYNALTTAQKALVSNYATLTAAEAEYKRLEAEASNQAAANKVITQINNLPATITLDDANAVAAVRTSYNALTPEQKALVTNYAVLTAAEARITALTTAKAAADAVVAKINALGQITLASGDAITAAEEAYNALSGEAKALVGNYSTLTAARTTYNGLRVSDFNSRATEELKDVTIANKADLEALVVEYNSLKAAGLNPTASILPRLNSSISRIKGYENAVQNVENLIDAIATPVTLDSLADIEAAEKAYAALSTQEQKDLVENHKTLVDARAAYDALLVGDAVSIASSLNKVKATSIIISDSLAINYKILVDSAYEIVGMEFTLAGETVTVEDYTVDGNGYLVFRYDDIAPDLMAETITSVIIVKGASDNEIRCNPNEYSIATYANKKIATEGLTELLASMVNYGDAAVAYTDTYTAPSTVIANWTDYADSAATVRDYKSIQDIGTEIASPSVTWGGASLILTDSIDIRINVEGTIDEDYVAKTVYGGEELTFDIVTENGESYFVWDIYNAAQMSSAVTFTVCDAAGNAVSNSLTYSVESYVADMLAITDDEKLVNLLTAMMQYGDAAIAYNNVANG